MALLQGNPKLHITTIGGNAVIASAALATLQELTETELIPQTLQKEKLFTKLLSHPMIKEVRGRGLMLAEILESAEIASEVTLAYKDRGLIFF